MDFIVQAAFSSLSQRESKNVSVEMTVYGFHKVSDNKK